MNKSIDTDYNEVYEGSYWHVGIVLSNRFGTRIEWTCGASDSIYTVPRTRVNDVLSNLRNGTSPEDVAKTLIIA